MEASSSLSGRDTSDALHSGSSARANWSAPDVQLGDQADVGAGATVRRPDEVRTEDMTQDVAVASSSTRGDGPLAGDRRAYGVAAVARDQDMVAPSEPAAPSVKRMKLAASAGGPGGCQ